MLIYPDIDPVLISIGPLQIRWYALAYIAGLMIGAWYMQHINRRYRLIAGLKPFDDVMSWAIIGIIVGGRLGYVLFYNASYYVAQPLEIFMIWHGGMSFHGGLIGVAVSLYLLARQKNYPPLKLADLCALAAPIGLFFGRIANFINGELYGRVTDVPWAMIFPYSDGLPRHPSQLYEAGLEGVAIFIILSLLYRCEWVRVRAGYTAGLFCILYAIARTIVELFREPDAHLGLILGPLSAGQLLSLPMLVVGGVLLWRRA